MIKQIFLVISLVIMISFAQMISFVQMVTSWGQVPKDPVQIPPHLEDKVTVTEVALLTPAEAAEEFSFEMDADGKRYKFDENAANDLVGLSPGARFVLISCQVANSLIEEQGEDSEITLDFGRGKSVSPTSLSTEVSIQNDQFVNEDSVSGVLLATVPGTTSSFDVLLGKLPLFKINMSALSINEKWKSDATHSTKSEGEKQEVAKEPEASKQQEEEKVLLYTLAPLTNPEDKAKCPAGVKAVFGMDKEGNFTAYVTDFKLDVTLTTPKTGCLLLKLEGIAELTSASISTVNGRELWIHKGNDRDPAVSPLIQLTAQEKKQKTLSLVLRVGSTMGAGGGIQFFRIYEALPPTEKE